MLSSDVARQLKRRRVSEEDVLEDFEASRKRRRAARVFRHAEVEHVFTPAAAHDEVFEYLPSLARKKRLDLDTLLLACAALAIVERSEYEGNLSTARRRIGKRDPDDVDVLALTLTFGSSRVFPVIDLRYSE